MINSGISKQQESLITSWKQLQDCTFFKNYLPSRFPAEKYEFPTRTVRSQRMLFSSLCLPKWRAAKCIWQSSKLEASYATSPPSWAEWWIKSFFSEWISFMYLRNSPFVLRCCNSHRQLCLGNLRLYVSVRYWWTKLHTQAYPCWWTFP